MLFRVKSKRVNVDTSCRNIGVMLIRLDQVEVRSKTFLKAVMSVELKLGANNWVASCIARSKTSMVGTAASIIASIKVGRSITNRGGSRSKSLRVVYTSIEESFNFGSGAVNVSTLKSGGNIREGFGHMSSFDIGEEVLLTSWGVVAPVSPASIDIIIISVVIPLVVVSTNNGIALNHPDKFLNWVVEIEFNLNIGVNS